MHEHHDTTRPATGARPFEDILAARLSRRSVMKGGLAAAAAGLLGGPTIGAALARPASASVVGFDSLPPTTVDAFTVQAGHVVDVVVPWGEPVLSTGPAWAKDASNSADDQAQQMGMGHDGMWFFPIGTGRQASRRGVLCVNHEYTTDHLLFPDGTAGWDGEKTRKSQHAHGVAVVGVGIVDGRWQRVDTPYNRRITALTPMTFDGPAAGHAWLQTAADPSGTTVLGTLNNCGNGSTPWGTYLTCEENFHSYFRLDDSSALSPELQALHARYGVAGSGGYQWSSTDERFRVDANPHEPNRFGWVVEIDPFDPAAQPVKHTALGRFKHEGAGFAEGKGREAVVYMGDDERFDYLYKFVSAGHWQRMRSSGTNPLSEGTLYVARFADDGTGEWVPVVHGQGPLTPENGWADQGDVVVRCRLAADALGATPMDRPEWTAVHPANGDLYLTLTNNTARTVPNGPNPRVANTWGHILRLREQHRNAASAGPFEWDLFVLAGPGGGVDGSTVSPDAAFGSPDGLWIDAQGRMWIQTDGAQPIECNDQLLAASTAADATIKRFAVGPKGCEVTGITMTPDRRTLFVNIQHPGDQGTAEAPTAQSSWPDMDPTGRPRPATVAIRREDGRPIGAHGL
jgi:secreted PhoX family phosphatase